MAELSKGTYSFDEDGMLRLRKDLDYMFHHLDDKNVRRLYTEYCEIKSEDGETEIDGPLLTMKAAGSSTIRLLMGYDKNSSDFLFNLYDQAGNPTLELNSTGNAVLRGDINTARDVFIGERLFLGWEGSTLVPTATLSTRGMYIMEPGTTKYLAAIYSTDASLTTDPAYQFEIESSKVMNFTAQNTMRIYMYANSTVALNSTDYIFMTAFNDRLCVGTDGPMDSTDSGTFIGSDYRNTYLTHQSAGWYNKVVSFWDVEANLDEDLRYFHTHNSRFIARPTTNWTAAGGSVTALGSTMVITSTRGVYVNAGTTNAYSPGLQSSFASIDCSKFPDGTAVTSDDWLIVMAWHTFTTSYNNSAQVHLGTDQTNRFYFEFTSGFQGGWNLHKRKIGAPDLTTGSPAWNSISWARVGFDINARPLGYGAGYIDYVGIVRNDPDDNTKYSAFQRDINSTHTNILVSNWGAFTISRNNEPCICQSNWYSYDEFDMLIGLRHDFKLTVENYAQIGNEMPQVSVYFSTANYLWLSLSSGVLRMRGYKNGSTFGDYINCESFSNFRDVEIGLVRHNFTEWKGWFRDKDNAESYREISITDGLSTKGSIASIYLGHTIWDVPTAIKNIKITPYNEIY